MADFWSEDWFDAVLQAGQDLPLVQDLSFSFDIEVAESEHGKVRAHGQVQDGQLAALVSGKYVPAEKGGKPDVSFIGKAKRLLPIVHGEQPALVAFMMGELKIEGAYELVVDHLANRVDRSALEAFRATVAGATN